MMASFQITKHPNYLKMAQSISRQAVGAGADEAVKLVKRKMAPMVGHHYKHLLKEVGKKLQGVGMPTSVETGGAHRIGFGLVGGGHGGIMTDYWHPLTPKYRKRTKISTKFWRKNSKLYPAYVRSVRGSQKVTIVEHTARRNHHKDRINTVLGLEFSVPKFPFATAVTYPFATLIADDDIADMTEAITRKGLGRARFAEQNDGRPRGERAFLRKMSAALGLAMRKDIRKKLRKI